MGLPQRIRTLSPEQVDTLFVCAMRDREEYGGAHMSDALR